MSHYIYNLAQLFSEVAVVNHHKTGLHLFSDEEISYGELDERSNQIANFLQERKIVKGDVVAISHDKSKDAFCIMIACLKLGIIYTNIDANSPVERLRRMVNTCQPKLFLTTAKKKGALIAIKFDDDLIVPYNTKTFSDILCEHSINFAFDFNTIEGNTPAYLMFTSGSTGFPKGVVISHANVLNFIKWTQDTYKTTSTDRFTNINPLHFDNSVFDFYASIFTGACLIPVPEEYTKNPRKLILKLNELKPTIWFTVPSMLVYILKLRALNDNDLLNLRIITFGGEGFPKSQLRNLWRILGKRAEFINVYGPTECTCICSSYRVSEADMLSDNLLPLGPIAPNFGKLILGQNKDSVRGGEIGELYISGSNVGLGYYNNMQLTQESFIQNPLHNLYQDIVYKSGDLVKHDLRNDLLHFCGRKDNQIKRMGYRIELEEIENAIGSLNYVEESTVLFDKSINDTGKIVAFVRAFGITEQTIQNDLQDKLPAYMLPDHILFKEHLPKNPNGKIDRRQLKQEIR